MRAELVFPAPLYESLAAGLLADVERESCAVAFLSRGHSERRRRYLVREFVFVPPEGYASRSADVASLRSEFVAQMVARARRTEAGLCFLHTHLGSSPTLPEFSIIDTDGEVPLLMALERRTGHSEHLAMVLSQAGARARMLGTSHEVGIARIGRESWFPLGASVGEESTYDRQVRAFGAQGQAILSQIEVGIVGLGGTGSLVAQQLAHLGVRAFTFVDPDEVDETNLNRLVGASLKDIGAPKVEVAKRLVFQISAVDPTVRCIVGDVTALQVSRRLLDADVVFGCTDSHGSRDVLNHLAYQYLIPVIDMGSSITASQSGSVENISGRIQALAPGLACLTCSEILDGDQVRWDYQTTEERTSDPYFVGRGEPAPAVISINGTVASLAISVFLGMVVRAPFQARLQLYDGKKGVVRSAAGRVVGGCVVCSSSGALARGNSIGLPGRMGTNELP